MRNYCSLSRFLNSSLALSIPHMADQCDKDSKKPRRMVRSGTTPELAPVHFTKRVMRQQYPISLHFSVASRTTEKLLMAIALISCLLLPFSFWRLELLDFSRKADFQMRTFQRITSGMLVPPFLSWLKSYYSKLLFRSLSTCSEGLFFFFWIMNHFF